MTTAERAQKLEEALSDFSLLRGWNASALCSLVERELGHAEILDGFRPYGHRLARAIPMKPLLHVVSSNTPHAALQSLVRGLLLGCDNWIKTPATGLPELEEFIRYLPANLASKVTLSSHLENSWLEKAEALIVFGSEETVRVLRDKVSTACLFLPHGHRLSLGIIFEDPDYSSVELAARDVFLYDQRGCLSPHALYITPSLDSYEYAQRLADALKKLCEAGCELHTPVEAASIFAERHYFRFLQSQCSGIKMWTSERSSNWTVIHDADPLFRLSPLGRTIFIRPLPSDLSSSLAPIRQWISTFGIWPVQEKYAKMAAQWGASRICPLGKMQFPPPDWHQDGLPVLSQLVRWIDIETE